MTESKGPENQDSTAGPGKKKRRTLLDRLRPYAVGTVAMAVVFGGSALIGAHVRATKDDKVKDPNGVVGAASVPGPAGSASPGPGPSPSPTASATGKQPKLDVPVRPSIPVTVTVYEDLRSADSKAFQEAYQATFDQLLTTGQVQLHYRLVTAGDRAYGGTGSSVAANAAACAQDQGRFTEFVEQVWANQPDPQTDRLADLALMKKFAKRAGKITMGTFEPCLEQRDHEGWVRQSQAAYAAQRLGAVPVVQINGVTVTTTHSTLTPQKLRKRVLAEAKRVISAQATPAAENALLR
jgi:Thioredoxin